MKTTTKLFLGGVAAAAIYTLVTWNEQKKVIAPLDYNKPIYTTDHAIVCPLPLLSDPRADHDIAAVIDAYTSFNDESKAEKLGCDILKGGIHVIADADDVDSYNDIHLAIVNKDYFTLEMALTNNADGSTRYVNSNAEQPPNNTNSSLGSELVATPASEPIPKGNVSVPSGSDIDKIGAIICPDSKTLAASIDDNNSGSGPKASIPTGSVESAMKAVKESIEESMEESAKAHGCTYIPPGTTLVSEGGNPIGSLAVVTVQMPDGTTIRGVTFPTEIIQSQQPATASQEGPSPDSVPSTTTGESTLIANTPTNVPPIDITPSSTQDPTESKRLNAEGLQMLSGANPNTASARNDFERAFQLDSTNVEALNNLGYVYEMLGDYHTAESALLKVLAMSPTRTAAQGNLGATEAELGKTQEAANHFCQYIHGFDSVEHGKSTLTRTFKNSDSNVQAAINMTLANCN